jgi:hypothetical protein
MSLVLPASCWGAAGGGAPPLAGGGAFPKVVALFGRLNDSDILPENRLLQPLELRARLEAEFLVQNPPHSAVGCQRVAWRCAR